MNYWVQTNEDMNPVLVTGVSDAEMSGIVKLLKALASDGELVEIADSDGNTIYDNYEQWRSVNSSKRIFTKYPSGYVKASNKSKKSRDAEIYEYLDNLGGYVDYDGRVELLMDDFGLSKNVAENYVWNHSSGLDRLNGYR